jgi:hypothetical protein
VVPQGGDVSGVSGWLRWPRGFSCPGCGSGGCWWTGTGLWMRADCGLKTSATAGTLHHRINRQHLPYYLDRVHLPVQPRMPWSRQCFGRAASLH